MKILFIAPLPPPVNGHSLVSKVLLDELVSGHQVEVVNSSKNSFKEGVDGFKRIVEVVEIIIKVWKKRKIVDAIYLTISESFAGNGKDLFTYLVCFKSLSKMYIHLHGGSIKRQLWDPHRLLFGINKLFIRKLAGVIISGDSHRSIFEGLIGKEQIHIVPNFAQDYLFSSEQEIVDKFSDAQHLRILFMSGLKRKKGYNELADAFFCLSDESKKKVAIDFAGRFGLESEEMMFLDKIAGVEQIRYHGTVDDNTKKFLFSHAHIFCLPTSYFEGQPISILEAYASGCVVVTTGQSGIHDIFKDGVNGFEIQERSAYAIGSVIEKVILKKEDLLRIAISNRKLAGEKYKTTTFNSSLRKIIESQIPVASSSN